MAAKAQDKPSAGPVLIALYVDSGDLGHCTRPIGSPVATGRCSG